METSDPSIPPARGIQDISSPEPSGSKTKTSANGSLGASFLEARGMAVMKVGLFFFLLSVFFCFRFTIAQRTVGSLRTINHDDSDASGEANDQITDVSNTTSLGAKDALTVDADAVLSIDSDASSTSGGGDEPWELLRNHSGHKYSCSGDLYDRYFAELPPIKLENMLVAPNKTVLWYGPSWLRQIFVEAMVAGMALGVVEEAEELFIEGVTARNKTNKKKQKNNSCAGIITKESKNEYLAIRPGKIRESELDDTNFVRSRFSNGATHVGVFNRKDLQHTRCLGSLQYLLRTFKFDAALFMQPHPDCYFDWREAVRAHPDKDLDNMKCVHTGRKKGRDVQYAISKQADLISNRIPVMFEVISWRGDRNHSTHGDSKFVFDLERELLSMDGLFPIVHADSSQSTHLCLPGHLAIMAKQLLNLVNSQF